MNTRREYLIEQLTLLEAALVKGVTDRGANTRDAIDAHAALLAAVRLDAELAGELPTQHATVVVAEPTEPKAE